MASFTSMLTTPFRFQSALFTVFSLPKPQTLRPTASVAGPSGEAEWHSPAATASTVATPAGRTEGLSAEDLESFRKAYTTDPMAELSRLYPTQPCQSNSGPEPATHLAEPVRGPFARIPSPPWMGEVRPSKKRKTGTESAIVTHQVAQPWACREEAGETTVSESDPRRNPPRKVKKPTHVDATTAACPTRQQRPTKPTKSGKNVKPVKAATGKRALRGAGVASDEAHRSEAQRKKVERLEGVQKRSQMKKDTTRAPDTTKKGTRLNPARGVTAQRLRLADDTFGSTSSGEEEVD